MFYTYSLCHEIFFLSLRISSSRTLRDLGFGVNFRLKEIIYRSTP
ncbi:hypothetical protein ERO13_A05G301166v2 [Gossypium hirsutum]|nr:hypothetical protein ERO13_A05G301166v2 [Gossypium hirsutum]